MSETDSDHEMGVNFESIEPVFEGLSYPITAGELAERYGDREIDRTSADPISIGDLFAGAGDQSFESAAELRQGMLSMMPAESVGRQRYSDRGGSEQQNIEDDSDRSDQ